ncbi:penicillin-binding protein 2 [Patescibacteria group bacterium]
MKNLFEPDVGSPQEKNRSIERNENEMGIEEVIAGNDEGKSVVLKRETKAFRWLIFAAISISGLLLGDSAYLQVVQNEKYDGLAAGNRNRIIPIIAPRGVLFDRNRIQLVENKPMYDAVMVPVDLPKDDRERNAVLKNASTLFEEPVKNIKTLYNDSDPFSFHPIVIKEKINRKQALIAESESDTLQGISIQTSSYRYYPQEHLLSHALGYVGKITAEEYDELGDGPKPYLLNDMIGKNGIEKYYENTLRGSHGKKQVEVDSRGNIINTLATKEPVPGNDIILSVDSELQDRLEQYLWQQLQSAGRTKASAVAMDPRNGEILALVNVPTYDNNLFSRGIKQNQFNELLEDEDQPLFNKATSGIYPPGSTFKPFVATVALEDGVVTPSTTIQSTGKITIGEWHFYDYDLSGHGSTDLKKAISRSVNTYFYYIGGGYEEFRGVGIQRIVDISSKFGFGDVLKVDIGSENTGVLPTPEWKEQVKGERWYVGDTYNASIGQGDVSVTPLQLAAGYTVIANEGTLYRPHFIRQIIDSQKGKTKKVDPDIIRKNVASKENLREIKSAMKETVESGSGRLLNSLPVDAGGKTGTAQYVIPNTGGRKGEHAWFASFAPVENPEIVLIVMLEGAGEGHDHAVPVAHKTLQWYFTRDQQKEKTNE